MLNTDEMKYYISAATPDGCKISVDGKTERIFMATYFIQHQI